MDKGRVCWLRKSVLLQVKQSNRRRNWREIGEKGKQCSAGEVAESSRLAVDARLNGRRWRWTFGFNGLAGIGQGLMGEMARPCPCRAKWAKQCNATIPHPPSVAQHCMMMMFPPRHSSHHRLESLSSTANPKRRTTANCKGAHRANLPSRLPGAMTATAIPPRDQQFQV